MEGLIYDIGTKSRSTKVHRMLYGSTSWKLTPADLSTTFRFECKQTGNCCRSRSRTSNHIVGLLQIGRIEKFAAEQGFKVRGINPYQSDRPSMELDGSILGGKVISQKGVSGAAGIAFVGAHDEKDCQFVLPDGKCRVHPVKPFLCKLAPVGLIFEHRTGGGRLLFAVSSKPECPECMEGREWTVGEWLQDNITVTDFNTWTNDARAEANWPRLV